MKTALIKEAPMKEELMSARITQPVGTRRRGARRAGLVLVGLLAGLVVGLAAGDRHRSRDERGLSQSTENAILLAGAVAVATVVVTAITIYVKSKLPG